MYNYLDHDKNFDNFFGGIFLFKNTVIMISVMIKNIGPFIY